jgi:hypothetical protein
MGTPESFQFRDVVTRIVGLQADRIVSVYHAHLWHMFAAENEPLKRWAGWALGLDGAWFVSLGVLASAFIGLGVAALLNRLWGRIVGDHGPAPIGAGPPAPAGRRGEPSKANWGREDRGSGFKLPRPSHHREPT